MYSTIALMAQDEDLRLRISACAAQEGSRNPTGWAQRYIWEVIANTEFEQAYQYAIDTEKPRPGWDEGVISDAVILAHVQPLMNVESRSTEGP